MRQESIVTLSPDGVFVVVAAYNEASDVQKTTAEAQQHINNRVLVDDGAPDETSECRGMAHLVRHPISRGQGAALQTSPRACA